MDVARDDDDQQREEQDDAVVALVLQPELAEVGLRAHPQARDRGGRDGDRIEVLERLFGHRRGLVDRGDHERRLAGRAASAFARAWLGPRARMARATGLGLVVERGDDPIARELHRRDGIRRRRIGGRHVGHRGEVRLTRRGFGFGGLLRGSRSFDRGTRSGGRSDHRPGLAVDVDHLADDDRGVHRGFRRRRQHRRIRDERRRWIGNDRCRLDLVLRLVLWLVVWLAHAPSFLNGERSSKRWLNHQMIANTIEAHSAA